MIEAYGKAGDAKSAEASCRECLAIGPKDSDCREHLAALRMEASDYRESAAQFQFILRNGTASKSVLDGLAYSFMKLGDYNIAEYWNNCVFVASVRSRRESSGGRRGFGRGHGSLTPFFLRPRFASGAADKDAGQKDQHAAHNHLKRRL